MTDPPTYTVATDFDEIEQLREVIDALRANNGKLLRLLRKRLSKDTHRRPRSWWKRWSSASATGLARALAGKRCRPSRKGYLSPVTSPGVAKRRRRPGQQPIPHALSVRWTVSPGQKIEE